MVGIYMKQNKVLINRLEDPRLKHLIILKLLLNARLRILNIGEYNPNKKRKILVVFDDMIADMLN